MDFILYQRVCLFFFVLLLMWTWEFNEPPVRQEPSSDGQSYDPTPNPSRLILHTMPNFELISRVIYIMLLLESQLIPLLYWSFSFAASLINVLYYVTFRTILNMYSYVLDCMNLFCFCLVYKMLFTYTSLLRTFDYIAQGNKIWCSSYCNEFYWPHVQVSWCSTELSEVKELHSC